MLFRICLHYLTVKLSSYNPIQKLHRLQETNSNGTNVLNNSDYITSAQVDSVGAQLQTVINGFEVLISGIGGSNSRDPYDDALKAVASGLDAAANSGNKLDLTEWQDIQTILNNSSILNDASGSYAAAIEAAAKIIADINSSIDTEFDATSGMIFYLTQRVL